MEVIHAGRVVVHDRPPSSDISDVQGAGLLPVNL